MTLKEINAKLAAKQDALHNIFQAAGPDIDLMKVDILEGDSAARAEAVQKMNRELTDLGKERDKLAELDAIAKSVRGMEPLKHDGPVDVPLHEEPKSLGQMFVESKAYKERGSTAVADVNLKTLMSTAAGWAPESTRIPRVELYRLREIAVVDAFPILSTSQSSIKYMEETTFTNNAAEAAEGAIYGEAALVLTERSVPVEKVAVWLPVTDEQMEDVEGIASYVDQRLTYMLRARLDGQLIAGDGSTPNLRGVLNAANLQSQAKGTDPGPDAVYKAIVKCRAGGFANPDTAIFHPNDWQDFRLLRTADGIYVFGSPYDPGMERIWGLPVIVTTAETENTAVVGAFQAFSALFMRRGIEFKVTDSHDTYFIYGKKAIRADMRCAAVYFRGYAFCKVTGL